MTYPGTWCVDIRFLQVANVLNLTIDILERKGPIEVPSKTVCSIDGFEVSEDYFEKKDSNHENMPNEQILEGLSYIDVAIHKYRYLKRLLDVGVSLTALIILAVPFLLIMAVIFIDDPGPVFFRQYRVGLHGKRFRIYKFRSMMVDAPKYMSTEELKNPEMYTTRVGKIIRKFSIDELPQFINVLLGDMSLVGPRPLISDEYAVHKMRMRLGVYNIRPGITGTAQINGRDAVSAADKVRYDVLYLEKFGFWTDLKILFMTIPKVLGGFGVM